jgi:hypothetical protein
MLQSQKNMHIKNIYKFILKKLINSIKVLI